MTYFRNEFVTLFHGDMRDIVPTLAPVDCVITDPPYAETKLAWDRWPDGWLKVLTDVASSMWCFGSMRMFMTRADEFADWRMSHEVVWEKHRGSGFMTDRFSRVHEFAVHWYRGKWRDVHHEVPRVPSGRPISHPRGFGKAAFAHTGAIKNKVYIDDGLRLARSVQKHRSMNSQAIHPTEKPVSLVSLLTEYACPAGGTILDPFAGSGVVGEVAMRTGRHAVLIETDERYCEVIANRLAGLRT